MGDIIDSVTAFLHSHSQLELARIAGYQEYIMSDAWVTGDFSKAWGSEKNSDPPQSLKDETEAFLRQQKAAATTTRISPSCYVTSDTEANTVEVWTSLGTANVLKSDILALIAALRPLAAPTTGVTPGFVGDASTLTPPKEALTGVQQAMQKRNEESMQYALKQQNKRLYGK